MNENINLTIRHARREDISALTKLIVQLGYPSTNEQVHRRFEILVGKKDENTVLVAELNGKIIGWVHAHIYNLLVDDPEVEIGGLVVDESMRGQGIGEKLMRAAEDWACEHSCTSVYVRSNTIRTRAHEFYKGLGYEIIKSQYAFRKTVP
jgi:N-acetylglutamate synthase-like GNAT family acetyltransferase